MCVAQQSTFRCFMKNEEFTFCEQFLHISRFVKKKIRFHRFSSHFEKLLRTRVKWNSFMETPPKTILDNATREGTPAQCIRTRKCDVLPTLSPQEPRHSRWSPPHKTTPKIKKAWENASVCKTGPLLAPLLGTALKKLVPLKPKKSVIQPVTDRIQRWLPHEYTHTHSRLTKKNRTGLST